MNIVILQQNLATYRLGFYETLNESCSFRLLCGKNSFSKGQESVTHEYEFVDYISNHFLCNRFLFQVVPLKFVLSDSVLVLENNFRTISSFLILLTRFFFSKKKTVTWGHVSGKGFGSKILSPIYNYLSDGFICYTEYQRKCLLDEGYSKPVGVATNTCVSAKECNNITNQSKIDFIYCGRLSEDKRVYRLIESFKLFYDNNMFSQSKLHIVGDGPIKESMIQEIKRLNLQEKIILYGNISDHNQLKNIYENCLFSISSGFVGLSVVQSFSYGVPVLFSQNEKHSPEIEYCVNNVNSLSFIDSNDLSNTIQKISKEKESWIRKSHSIYDHCRKNLVFNNMVDGFVELIKRV